jgi:hypothetical protein
MNATSTAEGARAESAAAPAATGGRMESTGAVCGKRGPRTAPESQSSREAAFEDVGRASADADGGGPWRVCG